MPNIAMWGKALTVMPRIDKTEWDALDLISRWLIATRSAVIIMTFTSATFAGLLAQERRSLRWTASLISDLCDASASVELIATATAMARTEAMHVDLCALAVQQLGGVVHEAHVPEPGSSALGAVALVTLLGLRRGRA